MQTRKEDRKREEIKKEQVESCICGSSCVCNKSAEVKGIPESVSLSASSLSANSASITSWFLFIHFMFVFYAPPPLSRCGDKYLWDFCSGLYLVGLLQGQTCHLYHLEEFLKQEA